MIQLESLQSEKSSLPIATQLREVVHNNVDLLEVASKLRVTPRTVKRVITGEAVSSYIKIKIETGLRQNESFVSPSKKSPVQHLLEINKMYQEGGTLRSVGAKVGLSGERIRQLLLTGSKVGLFKYQPPKPPLISRKKILNDYKKYLNFTQVAKVNNISLPYLKRLRVLHKIDQKNLHDIRIAGQKEKCIELYRSMKDQLGHYPKTTELYRMEKGPYFHGKILRLWGSFGAFRQTKKLYSRSRKSCA
jgi:hypothetical protein